MPPAFEESKCWVCSKASSEVRRHLHSKRATPPSKTLRKKSFKAKAAKADEYLLREFSSIVSSISDGSTQVEQNAKSRHPRDECRHMTANMTAYEFDSKSSHADSFVRCDYELEYPSPSAQRSFYKTLFPLQTIVQQ